MRLCFCAVQGIETCKRVNVCGCIHVSAIRTSRHFGIEEIIAEIGHCIPIMGEARCEIVSGCMCFCG